MALMVDEARWWWRERRWAHLASDHDLEELHRFAAHLGLHRVSFGGDHYDVTEEQRQVAIDAGVEVVPARELVRRLQGSGLRRAARSGSHRWAWVADNVWDPAAGPDDGPAVRLAAALGWRPPEPVAAYLAEVGRTWADEPFAVRVLVRPAELALLLYDPTDRDDRLVVDLALPTTPAAVTGCWVTAPAAVRLLELFISAPDLPMPTG